MGVVAFGGGTVRFPPIFFAQDIRDFRDFRAYDKLDVRFGREWKQAEVLEVDWEEWSASVPLKNRKIQLTT